MLSICVYVHVIYQCTVNPLILLQLNSLVVCFSLIKAFGIFFIVAVYTYVCTCTYDILNEKIRRNDDGASWRACAVFHMYFRQALASFRPEPDMRAEEVAKRHFLKGRVTLSPLPLDRVLTYPNYTTLSPNHLISLNGHWRFKH